MAVIDRYILSRCPISKQAYAMPHFVCVIVSENVHYWHITHMRTPREMAALGVKRMSL
ncbi:MAG: hypothetical protein WBZ67_18605 [Pseudolabrys sp.]